MQHLALVVLAALAPSACGNSQTGSSAAAERASEDRPPHAPATGAAAVEALRAHVEELQARPEHDADTVRVQHLLVAFAGSLGKPGVTRSREQAEQLAAELYARIQAGEDFATLIGQYTDDSPPGIYLMTATGRTIPRQIYFRGDMVPAFGNVGWRLAVGQIGVAPFDPAQSKYGWHIVKRLE